MRIHVTKPRFAWDVLEESPSLKTIRDFLEAIPDHRLLDGLQAARAKGRKDYPFRVLWGTLLVGLALRHPTVESCLTELRRNEGLRRPIAIETEEQVPNSWKCRGFCSCWASSRIATNWCEFSIR